MNNYTIVLTKVAAGIWDLCSQKTTQKNVHTNTITEV